MRTRKTSRTTRGKVAEFCTGRSPQPDAEFLAECGLPDDAEAARIALAVRRAAGVVGLVDPLFIRASDRFPEELGELPFWGSLEWCGFVIELEEELDRDAPRVIQDWRVGDGFTIKQLALTCYEAMRPRHAG